MDLNIQNHESWSRGNNEIQKLAPLHERVQLIIMEANLNSNIQILRRATTVGKRYFGLYKGGLVPCPHCGEG